MGKPGIAPAVGAPFAVLQQPCADGAVAVGLLSGLTVCQVNINNSSDHYADLRDSEGGAELSSGPFGAAEILYHAPGTGLQWSLVRLGNRTAPTPFPAQITGGDDDAWEWEELDPDGWGVLDGGRTSDTEAVAAELNGHPLASGDRVILHALATRGTDWIYVCHDDARDL